MKSLRSLRGVSSVGVGLILLLLVEVPALAYPQGREVPLASASTTAQLGSNLLDHGVPRLSAAALRRLDATESQEPQASPTLPEGAVFTVLGAGFICGGAITLGVGLAQFIPIVTATGLIETAVVPLVLAGVGLTLLVVGIPFLIHGIVVLKQVRAAEQAAPTAALVDARWAPHAGLEQSVLLRF